MQRTTAIHEALKLAELLRPSWPTVSARIAASGVPTCEVAEAPLREKLTQIESELSEAREERAVRVRERDKTRNEYANSGDLSTGTQTFKRAERASEELRECDDRIADLQKAQVGALKMLGRDTPRGGRDQNGPRSGDFAGDAWAQAARALGTHPRGGGDPFSMAADSFLNAPFAAGFKVSPSEGLTEPSFMAPFVEKALDLRFLYPSFQRTRLEKGELALWDYKQKGSRTVTGEVERDPVSTEEKATLDLEVELETPSLRTFAVVVANVPVKLLEAEEALRAFLETEMAYQVNLAVDRHVLAQIAAAAPPVGETGATIIEKVRTAVSAMRALGAQPTMLALSPTDAAALDTMKTGTGGLEQYIFVGEGNEVGSVPSLFGLAVLELPHIEKPMLLDPKIAGVLYSATGLLLIDPYSGMTKNVVRLRMEVEGLLHVRDVSGVYIIDKTA